MSLHLTRTRLWPDRDWFECDWRTLLDAISLPRPLRVPCAKTAVQKGPVSLCPAGDINHK